MIEWHRSIKVTPFVLSRDQLYCVAYATELPWDQASMKLKIIFLLSFLSPFCFFLTDFPGNTHLINHLHRYPVLRVSSREYHIICQVSLTSKNQSQCPVFLICHFLILWFNLRCTHDQGRDTRTL